MNLAFAAGYVKNLFIIEKWRKYKQEFSPKRLPSGMYRCKRFTFCNLREARRFCKEYSMYLATQKACVGIPRETGNHVYPTQIDKFIQKEYQEIAATHVERLSSKGMCAVFISQVLGTHGNAFTYHINRDEFNRLQLIVGLHKGVSSAIWIHYSASLITEKELFEALRTVLNEYLRGRRHKDLDKDEVSDE